MKRDAIFFAAGFVSALASLALAALKAYIASNGGYREWQYNRRAGKLYAECRKCPACNAIQFEACERHRLEWQRLGVAPGSQ